MHIGSETPVVLDVAHNPDGMSATVTALLEAFAFDKVTFVIGILEDKDHVGIITELARVPCRLILTSPANARARSLEELGAVADQLGLEHRAVGGIPAAIDAALEEAGEQELVCITGSHYVVGEARTHLLASRSSNEKGN